MREKILQHLICVLFFHLVWLWKKSTLGILFKTTTRKSPVFLNFLFSWIAVDLMLEAMRVILERENLLLYFILIKTIFPLPYLLKKSLLCSYYWENYILSFRYVEVERSLRNSLLSSSVWNLNVRWEIIFRKATFGEMLNIMCYYFAKSKVGKIRVKNKDNKTTRWRPSELIIPHSASFGSSSVCRGKIKSMDISSRVLCH